MSEVGFDCVANDRYRFAMILCKNNFIKMFLKDFLFNLLLNNVKNYTMFIKVTLSY